MTVMLWAEATSDAFEGPPGRAARMQIDHKMVNPAPGMAVSPVRVALPASRAKKPQCVAWIRISNSVVVFRHSFAAPRRDAPELCMNPSPKEGVGNAGCPLHPRPRVRFALVKSTRVNEYPGITRRSRTQWFYGLCRALPGDRALLPPSPCGLKVLSSPVEPNEPPQDLTPASRRQDHTTSPSASSAVVLHAANRSRRAIRPALASHAQHCRVHRTPPRVRDDHDTPLWWGGMARVLDVIWVRWQQIFFGKSEIKDSTAL